MDGITASTIENEQEEADYSAVPERKPRQQTATRDTQNKSGTSVTQASFMIIIAAFFDGAQFIIEAVTGIAVILIPVGIGLAWAVDAAAWLTFFLWLHSRGSGMIKKGGLGQEALSKAPFVIIGFAFGFEFIPIINALPGWTAAIVTIILKERTMSLAQTAGVGFVASALGKTAKTQA